MRLNYAPTDWPSVRQRRKELLAETDLVRTWERITDAQRAELALYREALFAVVDIFTNAADVLWPPKPTWM